MTISESLSEQLRDPCHASNERNEDHDHIPAVDVGMGVAFHPPSDQHMATEPQGQGIEAGHGKVLEAPEAANPQHHGESTWLNYEECGIDATMLQHIGRLLRSSNLVCKQGQIKTNTLKCLQS